MNGRRTLEAAIDMLFGPVAALGRSATFKTPAKTPNRPLPIAVRRIAPEMSRAVRRTTHPHSAPIPQRMR
jgi:hypothetical protein